MNKEQKEMKDLIKKQEEYLEEFAELHNQDCSCLMEDPDACDCDNMKQIKHIMDKVRKETAEAVADKMIGEERDSDDSVLSKKCKSRLTAFKSIMDYQGDLGYNERIKEEKEIKKYIIENL